MPRESLTCAFTALVKGLALRPVVTAVRAAGLVLLLAMGPMAVAQAYEPAMNYTLQCMGCHTPDGAGVPGKVPSIQTTLLPFARMAEGRQFLVQVPGSAQSTLTNAELADLLNWMIQTLSTAPGKRDYKRFTEAEVAGYRPHALIQVRATRERLLAAAGAPSVPASAVAPSPAKISGSATAAAANKAP